MALIFTNPPDPRERTIPAYIFKGIITGLIAISVGFAVYRGDINLIPGILLTVLTSITTVSFLDLRLFLRMGDSLGVESSLPSIDGSEGGWRFTPSLTMFLLTCLFAFSTLTVFLYSSGATQKTPIEDNNSSQHEDKRQPKDSVAIDSLKLKKSDSSAAKSKAATTSLDTLKAKK